MVKKNLIILRQVAQTMLKYASKIQNLIYILLCIILVEGNVG
jgi:hypothetical protein